MYLQPHGALGGTRRIKAIEEADLIIVGPGSLYTSLLFELDDQRNQPSDALAVQAVRVYVCNVATEPGENHRFWRARPFTSIG